MADIELGQKYSNDSKDVVDEQIYTHPVVRWFHLDELEEINFVTSHLVSTPALFVIRLLLSAYCTVVVVTSFVNDLYDGWWLAYFTHLTFIGLTTYLIASTVHTGLYIARGNIDSITNQPKAVRWLYWVAYEHAVAYHLIVPIVYWLALADVSHGPLSTWLTVSMHGFDFISILFEVILSKNRVVLRHIIFFIITSITYLFYTWILHSIPMKIDAGFSSENRWVYPFLDWDKSTAPGWYIGLLIGFLVVYFACFGVHRFREYAVKRNQ